jgi:hypothetical protein
MYHRTRLERELLFAQKMLSEYFCMQEKCKEKNVRDVQNLKFAKMLKKIKLKEE